MTRLVHCSRKQTQSGNARSLRSIRLGDERSEVARLTVNGDLGNPFHRTPFQIHASKTGRCPYLARHVLTIHASGDWPQIHSAIIELVPIPMVALNSISAFQAKQLTVQSDGPHVGAIVLGSHHVPERTEAPPPLARPRSVIGVNDGVGADRTVSGSQGDTYGILKAHQDSPPGVVPRGGDYIAGAFACLNFTIGGAS